METHKIVNFVAVVYVYQTELGFDEISKHSGFGKRSRGLTVFKAKIVGGVIVWVESNSSAFLDEWYEE